MKKFLLVAGIAVTAYTKLGAQGMGRISLSPASTDNIPNAPVFIEEVKKTGNDLVIPYHRYRLANGLNVIIHEDHSDPICYVDVTYHVGSAREQQGRSGFAHFFEHMMFQGSKNVADEQHVKTITEAGGTLNGSTNTDRTNYFETVPSNQLEKMLWLEADRMGFLLDSVTQRKFEVQRATVKNERGQRYDNAPYGVVGEKIGEALYPQGHPYSWTTIGYIVDLNRVDVNDLKRFYMRWYGANNAVLTIAGDVNAVETLDLVNKYFGSIAYGPEVTQQQVQPVKLDANRYISYEDNVKFPMLTMVYPTTPAYTKDAAALDILSSILSDSQGSPMYKAFIESKKAVVANSFQFSRELAGQFHLAVRANPGTQLASIEKELRAVLEQWAKKGVTDDDLVKFKAQFKSDLYNQLSTVQGKGATLASYFTIAHNANNLKTVIDRYMSITKADVMNVYETYIKDKPAVILSCLPKGKGDLKAHDDTWKMYERTVELESAEYKSLSYTEPKDDFNRAVPPLAKPAVAVTVPNYYNVKLSNGVPVIGIEESEIPKVNMLITFKAGHRYEQKEKSGLSQLLAAMLTQSTMKTSAEEIENKLNRLGATVDVSSGDEDISVSIQTPKENVEAVVKIVQECLFEPKFDTTEFSLEKKKQIDAITQSLTNASAMADMAYRKLLYGNNHVMGYTSNGTAETLTNITIDDVKKHYQKLNAAVASVAISGDIKHLEAMAQLAFLTKLKAGAPGAETETAAVNIDKTKIYFVDKKNAAQSEIRVGYIALPYQATGDFYKNTIMNFSFAGSFNSRVNALLRETKGWTYGVRGGFSGSKYAGPYTISGGFKANTTDSTLVEIFNEFKKYTEYGIKDEELAFAKNAMLQSDALKYESPSQKLVFIKRVLDYNLPKDYVAKQGEILNNISRDEINSLAKKYLPYNNMVVVVVGDKASNFEKVKKLGFDVVEIDTNGKTIGQ